MTDPNITGTNDELKDLVFSARRGDRKDGLTEAKIREYAKYRDGLRNSLEGEELQQAIKQTEAAIREMRGLAVTSPSGNRT